MVFVSTIHLFQDGIAVDLALLLIWNVKFIHDLVQHLGWSNFKHTLDSLIIALEEKG